ncbi:hypothetical protein ZHAS_00014124 [Anopheles sinensis]|uniref:Uncharacterized protein n=1 Tax=Anopheles sinensis TaxID=74873 RepID=A0A084W7E5_ANOSI|nr:hypothetical protein ZHAS_00014124 [Anopheles sinensis]
MSRPTNELGQIPKRETDIRGVLACIQRTVQEDPIGNGELVTEPPVPSEPQSVPMPETIADDAFAKKIFLQHTNIEQIVLEKLPQRSVTMRQKYQLRLYEQYLENPSGRQADPLHLLRFETPFWGALFRMAAKIPLRTEEDYHTLVDSLAKEGIKKMCFVDMTRNNLVLEDERKVITVMQSTYTNWSGKLWKLNKYLQDCQRIRERRQAKEKRKLLKLIEKHSNCGKLWHILAEFKDRMLSDLLGPIEKRTLLIWQQFKFDDDALNRKYNVGRYCDESEVNFLNERISTPTSTAFLGNQIPSTIVTGTEGEQQNVETNKQTPEHSTMADSFNSTNDQQEPPAKHVCPADFSSVMPLPPGDVGTQQNSPDIHKTTYASSIPAPQPITDAPEYRLDYIKSSTNIYELAIYKRMQKYPNTQMTPEKADKIVKKLYDFYRPSFAQLELPTVLRKLNLLEQMDVKTKGAYTWACEKLGIPIAAVPASKMPAIESIPEPIQPQLSQIVVRPDSEPSTSRPTEAFMSPIYPTQDQNGIPGLSEEENFSTALKLPTVVQSNETVLSTLPENDTVVVIKQEGDVLLNDCSGYEGYIEEISFPGQDQVMDDSPDDLLKESERPEPYAEENTPNVEKLPEPNTTGFMPPVYPTQSRDECSGSSEEDEFPTVLKPPAVVQTNETVPSTLPESDTVVVIKQEQESDSSPNDISGYEGYVEEIVCPGQAHGIDDSEAQSLLDEFASPERNTVQNRSVGLFQTISNIIMSLFSHTEAIGGLERDSESYGRPLFPSSS